MTQPRVYGFEKADAERLLTMSRRGADNASNRVPKPLARWPWSYVAKTRASGVPARNGNTPGTAPVDVFRIQAGGTTLESAAYYVDAYNLAESAIAANAWVMLLQDYFGIHWVVWEECTE
jgi:hypothetical protein